MKKSLIALAALAATSAFAQSTVTLSGTAGAAYGQGIAAGAAQLYNPDATTNTVALSGSEDLGGGLKANFFMEQRIDGMSGISVATGARQYQNTWVGVSGNFGAVQIGRYATASVSGFDAFAGYGDNRTDYASAYTVSSRNDKTFQYTTPTFSGFNATFATTKDNTLATQYQYFNVSYSAGKFAARYNQERNTTGLSEYNLGASYDFGVAKVMAIYAKVEGAVTDTQNTSIGVRAPFGATTLKAQYRTGDTASALAVGADYALSKRTRVFLDVGSVDNAVQNAYRLGIQHSF